MDIKTQIQRHRSLSKLALDTLNKKLIHEAQLLGYNTMQQIEKLDDLKWEHQKDSLIEIFNLSQAIRTIEKSVETALSSLRNTQKDLESKERKES
jgi:hypothetical protein|tara:strand:- start:407 stop:691 length:285 start_codon:yes stop_codon:yes gene_type:complete